MTRQSTSAFLMVRPADFGFDPITAHSNPFQKEIDLDPEVIRTEAVKEFDRMVGVLQAEGLDVNVFVDSALPSKPNAVFPNNWFSTHADGSFVLYPMLSVSRRAERVPGVIGHLEADGWRIDEVLDISFHEGEGLFLEGTGSMVLDRVHGKVYACLSQRTHPELLRAIAYELDLEVVEFHATDHREVPVYHTNVMMAIGTEWAVVCADAIEHGGERKQVLDSLVSDGLDVVEITRKQMNAFAGNMLELARPGGEKLILLSETALDSLDEEQKARLSRYGRFIPVAIPIIEQVGGGSVRCMVAEIFLPPLNHPAKA